MALRQRDRADRGFTLVELLVVVGIITILISILLPALARVREQANRAKCAANLHSIGHGLVLYAQQYGYYPGAFIEATSNAGSASVWPVRLLPFVGGERHVFDCPSEDDRCEWKDNAPGLVVNATAAEARYGYSLGERLLLGWSGMYFSYGYNAYGTGERSGLGLGNEVKVGLPEDGPLRASRVRVPEEMIAISDSNADAKFDQFIRGNLDGPDYAWPGRLHAGGSNVLFCDGHVAWYLRADLLFGSASVPSEWPKRRRWNNHHGIER